MSAGFDRSNYHGQVPANLTIEERADGGVRFRVSILGGREACVDLNTHDVAQLVENLRARSAT